MPGGRRWVQDLLATARERSVFVHEPFDPPLLVTEIEAAIRAEGLDTCLRLDREAAGLVDQLRLQAGAHASSVEGFALHLDYAVLLAADVDPADTLSAELRAFARVAASRADGAAPRIIQVSRLAHEDALAPGWTRLATSGVLDALDSASFAAEAARAPASLTGRLAIAVAIEVGGWDLDIVERIQLLPERCAIRPDLHLDRWTDERADRWAGSECAEWVLGSSDDWGSEPCVHPLFLAVNSPSLLTRRVWRGHVTVLFPWLEELRQQIVRVYRASLVADQRSYDNEVEALDWGPICWQLSNLPDATRDFLHGCRKLRNDLAHGRPATWVDITACVRGRNDWRPVASVGSAA